LESIQLGRRTLGLRVRERRVDIETVLREQRVVR
jgi:hypothetical protein